MISYHFLSNVAFIIKKKEEHSKTALFDWFKFNTLSQISAFIR